MSVDVCLYGFVGIKGNYNEFAFLKNKNDVAYDNLEKYNNVVYLDYLPNDFVYERDGMGGEYAFLGKHLFIEDEMYDGLYKEYTPEDIQKYKNEVIQVFNSLNIKFREEDIKLHILTHFS